MRIFTDKHSKPDVYLFVLDKSLHFGRNGPAASKDAGFGGSGRSLPNSDNLKGTESIGPLTSKIQQVYI